MTLNSVGRQADQLDTSSGELRLELCESTEFGRADRSVVFGVGEEDDPLVANEFVEVDRTGGGLCLEVGGNAAESEAVDGQYLRYRQGQAHSRFWAAAHPE